MRLTLRTLLAYRDGVLDPKDAADLEAKILDSSTAQRISKRISDEMRHRKLAPIPVDAREFGFEANMVAEFLDDTIPMETLPDMERKCLENNTLLSEIGSCHQILSRALSIPAPVAASLRLRIHDLPKNQNARLSELNGRKRRIDGPSLIRSAPSDAQTSSVAMPATKTLRKPSVELRGSGIELHDGLGRQVPEYLIGRDHGWLKNAAIALLLLTAFVVVGAIAIGPFDRVSYLLRKSKGNGIAPPPLKNSIDAIPIEESNDSQPSISESSALPPVPAVVAAKVPGAASIEIPKKENGNGAANAPSMTSLSKRRMQWLPDTKGSSESIVLKLVKSESDSGIYWTRMSPGEYANAGERIVVPPTQRTEMRMDPGIRLLCAGDNDLESSQQGDTLKIDLHSGRFLIFATPDARELSLDCNGLELSISFATSDASCALEVQNVWSALTEDVSDNSKVESRSKVRLIGVEGALRFATKYAGGNSAKGTLAVGQYIDWMEGAATATLELAEAPWWFRTSILRPIDQLAATDLQRTLSGRLPGQLETELSELTNHRRGETASLAARTRAMLGFYDGLFEADGILNRKGLHSHWQSILAQIPQSLSREDHRAKLVKEIQSAAPNRFPSILSLLVPPTKEQLLSGADKMLVEGLASPRLDERVLAFNQLNLITGKSLGYQPDKSQSDAIALWRKMLSKNEIRYVEVTTP